MCFVSNNQSPSDLTVPESNDCFFFGTFLWYELHVLTAKISA